MVQPAAEAPARQPASWLRGKLMFWLVWPPLVALDLWSKAVAFAFLEREQSAVVEGGRQYFLMTDGPLQLRLVAWRNPGTIWGLFPNYTFPLIVLRVGALFVLAWFLHKASPKARLQQLVLSLITAGALGNLYDNFFALDHKVRDFIFFSGTWPMAWQFPAFNVADSCITVGAITLLFLLLREDLAAKKRSKQVSS